MRLFLSMSTTHVDSDPGAAKIGPVATVVVSHRSHTVPLDRSQSGRAAAVEVISDAHEEEKLANGALHHIVLLL